MKKLILFLIVYEITICILRKIKRRVVYARANKRAKQTGKKLLVIGDPYNGVASKSTGIDYDCGDLCIDLTGCPKCPESIKGRLEDTIANIKLDEYVIYISCVLEYVDDLEYIQNFLNKVDPKDLFVVNVEWYSLMSCFYPHFLIGDPPPRYIYVINKYVKNPF
jgi:hypothetical protein